MQHAAETVISREMALNEAAIKFGIPKTTLFRYVAKLKRRHDDDSLLVTFKANYGVRRIFSDGEESMIADYLVEASKLHHGLSVSAA
jgi:hypothetical protein